MIAPESLMALCSAAANTDPLRVPVAPANIPVPPTTTSVSVPPARLGRVGLTRAGAGWVAKEVAGGSIYLDEVPPHAPPNRIDSVAWPSGTATPVLGLGRPAAG